MTKTIKEFNEMYGLPVADYPGYQAIKDAGVRLRQFRKAIQDEVQELDDVISMVDQGYSELKVLTALADFLTDVQVYCQSEMVKWGLPIQPCMDVVMLSNASKLGADGKPIVVEGKVQKGPHYFKPEPFIESMLRDMVARAILAGEEAPEPRQAAPGRL